MDELEFKERVEIKNIFSKEEESERAKENVDDLTKLHEQLSSVGKSLDNAKLELKKQILLDKIRGCFMGAMIGDAMGMPWEVLSRDAILDLTNGKGIQGFEDPGVRKIKDSEKTTLGDTTDDWFLTKTVAESLIACKGFDLNHQALRHVKALETSTFGWGKTTKNSIKEIKDYFDSRGEIGRNPATRAVNDGAGNGVAMKIALLACFNSVFFPTKKSIPEMFSETLADHIYDLGFMTHQNVDASYSAVAVAVYIWYR